MVGRLNLPNATEGDPLEMSCKAERGLDSPDSGLPSSPSPSAWLQAASADKVRGVSPVSEDDRRSPLVVLPSGPIPQRHLLSFGEGITLEPLPAREMRYTSSVCYNSERHFIQNVTLQPCGQVLGHCRQTVVVLPHSTWRHYKTQLELEPRQRPQRFCTTTIIYPKTTSSLYATELSYDCHRRARRFLSSVELEAAACRKLSQ